MKQKNSIWIYPLVLMGFVLIFTNSCKKEKKKNDDNNKLITVTDIDSNVYHAINIGTQVWMKENLKVTHYRNGDPIANVSDNTEWSELTTGANCDYNNTLSNSITYGKLYNWYTVQDSRNIAPTGWHVPTDVEWTTLIDFLGSDMTAGDKLKETGTTHWQSLNTDVTNESDFTARPGGDRNYDGTFEYVGDFGNWWSSTELIPGSAWYRSMGSIGNGVDRSGGSKKYGFSVRCIKDN